MIRSLAAALFLSTAIAGPLSAQDAIRSKPTALPVDDATPAPKDTPYPGTIRLEVDASDITQRIYRVKETIPVAGAGPMTLLMPEWLPGNHAPRGQIEKLTDLVITANGQPVQWVRDPLDVYAFKVDVPQDATEIVASFQFLSATQPNQGRVVITPKMMNIQWEQVSLYPAGYYTRQIPIRASVIYPAGWQAATALRGTKAGDTVTYDTIDYEALQDSPVFAGRYFKAVDLGSNVTLNMVADDADELAYKPEQMAKHRKLVAEAGKLFGAYHFDHYDFLLAITDEMGGIGLEHHRSSENQVEPGYFKDWDAGKALLDRNLLPHEFTHSWDGKFRRPDLLWTPDFRTPMQDNLLWVYEGQTQFWGYVLGARSGLFTKQETLDAYASIAARLDTAVGRRWRPLEDTTLDPVISARRPKGWTSWQRSEDYYNEGLMMWLEADAIISKATRGRKGLDDFAKAFFGINPGDWGEVVYNRDDLIRTLNGIAPYDWAGFFHKYVDSTTGETPKGGFFMGGYKLVYADEPNSYTKAAEGSGKYVDQAYGIGLNVKNDGDISAVIWDSAAFKAGLTVGAKIIAVNGDEFSPDVWKAAIRAKTPIQIILKQDKYYRTLSLDYSGGLRYPRLEKTGEGEGSLDRLLKPRT
ncbi:putative metalloprotease with PDZ domain [Sphingobium sp. OAS761]|uniref:M61 family metallopeptidase n=1 Tax=Sphingobium sp. OAS761 TaxID=2817901 RepID=UPI00209C7711|nr:peptidase M61 [Sphingobium sp. OAS761]MCP1470160.1 putative metalloprotease with PDZ domain [Sphingobium sp. OAS761]